MTVKSAQIKHGRALRGALFLFNFNYMPKVLFLGDIVGRPGRTFVAERVPSLKAELGADIVIANAENSAGGAGITKKIADQLIAAGVDAITLGDHVWDQKNFENEIDGLEQVCRPANLPEQNPGRTHLVIDKDGFRLAILTVLGRNYLTLKSSCPFKMVDAKLAALKDACDAVFVESHMEATSEKIALGWYQGTAYLSDAGMCGPYASVLGRDVDSVVASFLDGMKRRFPVAEDDVRICGCLIDIDAATGLATSFERIEVVKD